MESEYRTWIVNTAEGLDNLALSSRLLREELADMEQIVEERYRLEEKIQTVGCASCCKEQAERTKIIAERQPVEEGRDQTSQSQSKLIQKECTPVHRCQHDAE